MLSTARAARTAGLRPDTLRDKLHQIDPFKRAPRKAGGQVRTTPASARTVEAATTTGVVRTEEVGHQFVCSNVHPHLQNLFQEGGKFPNHPVGGRTLLFQNNWARLTNDQNILSLVSGHEIDLLRDPMELSFSKPGMMILSKEEENLVDTEIKHLLAKRAIKKVPRKKEQILSNIFLREKKDGGQRPIINLKRLNAFTPYLHFKMEGLLNLRDLMRPNDFMVKLDLKDAYFTLPLGPGSQKLVAFEWRGNVFEFQVLCFGLAPAPRLFTKVLKVPLGILRKLGMRIIAYLDDFLLLGQSLEDILTARDSMVHLLENLGFMINLEKSILTPCKRLEFLGVIVDSNSMSLCLPEGKAQSLTALCQKSMSRKSLSTQELASLVGRLVATMPAVSHTMIQIRYLQRCLRSSLQVNRSYQTVVTLSDEAILELKWWSVNLSLLQGKPLTSLPPDMIIQSDAAKTGGWGAHCQGWKTGGQWTKSEDQMHINVQELLAAHLAIQTFTKWKPVKSIHLQIDNQVALAYITNQGGTKSLDLLNRAKELWDYLRLKGISLSAEWLPTDLNVEADAESRNVEDSSEWKLNQSVFHQICNRWGQPTVDLFASRTSHQMDNYMSFKMDPGATATDAFQQPWENMRPYAFPPFSLVGRVLRKVSNHQCDMILIAPVWPCQPWYPLLLEMCSETPLLILQSQNLLTNPKGESHPLLREGGHGLQLAAWMISGDACKQREFQMKQSSSFATEEGKAHSMVTTSAGRNSLAGLWKEKLIQFDAACLSS